MQHKPYTLTGSNVQNLKINISSSPQTVIEPPASGQRTVGIDRQTFTDNVFSRAVPSEISAPVIGQNQETNSNMVTHSGRTSRPVIGQRLIDQVNH